MYGGGTVGCQWGAMGGDRRGQLGGMGGGGQEVTGLLWQRCRWPPGCHGNSVCPPVAMARVVLSVWLPWRPRADVPAVAKRRQEVFPPVARAIRGC